MWMHLLFICYCRPKSTWKKLVGQIAQHVLFEIFLLGKISSRNIAFESLSYSVPFTYLYLLYGFTDTIINVNEYMYVEVSQQCWQK